MVLTCDIVSCQDDDTIHLMGAIESTSEVENS